MLGSDWETADLSAELRGTLGYLEALTRRPDSVDRAAVDVALGYGVEPGALEQATLMVALFSYMNRMVDAFGADVTPEQADQIASFLDKAGGGAEFLSRPKPWQRLRGQIPAALTEQLDVIRTGDGDCPAEIRTAIEARVAAESGARRTVAEPLPDEVEALAATLSADAHGVTDGHFADLKAEGWSEEAIYEMVFVASFAAGIGRLERSVAVLADR